MKFNFIMFLSPLLVLSACNGGGGGGGSVSGGGGVGSVSTISAQFIDSPVKGLDVEGEKSGKKKTGENGRFSCESGESITFYLRDLKIGSTKCGESKVYLDDVVPSNSTADKFAAILQSLSKTGSSDLDLSHIPDNHKISEKVDFSDATSILDSIDEIKDDFPQIDFKPKVRDLAAAREHVNENLPALSTANASILDSLIANPKVVYAKLVGVKTSEFCEDGMMTEVRLKKDLNSQYSAELNRPQYLDGCDDGSIDARCTSGWQNWSSESHVYTLTSWKSGLENKMIIGPKIKFNRTETNTFVASDTETLGFDDRTLPRGAIMVKNFINGVSNVVYPISWDADIPYILNTKGLFPTTIETVDLFSWDYTVANGVSGTYEESWFTYDITNYVSASEYQFDKVINKCVYDIITPNDSDVHAADGVYAGSVACDDTSSLPVSLTVNGYRGTLSLDGISVGQIAFSNDSITPLDTPYLDFILPDQSLISGQHNPAGSGTGEYSFNYSNTGKKCDGGRLVKQ